MQELAQPVPRLEDRSDREDTKYLAAEADSLLEAALAEDKANRAERLDKAVLDSKVDSHIGLPCSGPLADTACSGPSEDTLALDKAWADSTQAGASAAVQALEEEVEVVAAEVEVVAVRPQAW